MRYRGSAERAETSGPNLGRGVNSNLAVVAFGLCCGCYWKWGLQASPVSFNFNALNLIVFVELSKSKEEIRLSPLDWLLRSLRCSTLRWSCSGTRRAG